MDNYSVAESNELPKRGGMDPDFVPCRVVPDPPAEESLEPPRPRRVVLPLALFLLTCASTFLAGMQDPLLRALAAAQRDHWEAAWLLFGMAIKEGTIYAGCLMTILICHEAGHFLQARRYGVDASFPYFIPMPFSPIGTMGAVIAMDSHVGDRKALFDIGISGPLAGLIPTLLFSVIGLKLSRPELLTADSGHIVGVPLIFQWLTSQFFPVLPRGFGIEMHPMAFAGWVGLLITAINLFPIGQLDGGHVLYGLLRKRAHAAATFLLFGAGLAVVLGVTVFNEPRLIGWTVMLFLLVLMGPRHPPTANDDVPLGAWRYALGWLTLAFLPLGFTPVPFLF